MKVLLINGSPNAKGCTYTALSEVEKILNENNIETEMIQIGNKAIRGCIGCGGCKSTKRCVFDDDLVNEVIAKMESADGLIIGSPVYFASPNGNLMSMLDRMFYAGDCFAHKPAAAVVSARRAGTTVSLDDLNKYFSIRQMLTVGSTYWNMVHGSKPEDVLCDEEGLQTMRNLGRNMAWILKCIEAGAATGIKAPAAEREKWTNFIRN
ncbi:MAG: flavodoxin family protein [Lachnospiraceae bacterium]|nr:flavodoxin family protein [Lachnospiraceae bacterium]